VLVEWSSDGLEVGGTNSEDGAMGRRSRFSTLSRYAIAASLACSAGLVLAGSDKLGAAMAVAIICTLDDAKRLLGRYRCTARWSLSETYPAQSRQAFVDERDCCGTFADRAAYTLHRSRARVTNGVHARHARLERHGCGPRSASITSGTGGNQAPFFAAQRALGLARRMAYKPFLGAFGKPLIRSS
jgi:hypothetical protein